MKDCAAPQRPAPTSRWSSKCGPRRTGWRTAIAATVLLTMATIGCTSDTDRQGRAATASTSAISSDDDRYTGADHDVTQLSLAGDPVDLPDGFFGFNAASIVSPTNTERMRDPDLWDLLHAFPTRLIRVSSGTAAQWIDWRTGDFIDEPGSPFATVDDDRRGITMDEWAELVKSTGAVPVWDLNVLTSTLDDQIEMLTAAERLGMPVRFIELGNELWDIRGPYVERYPTGAAYADEMNQWIPVLRQRFPDAAIAVAGADGADAMFNELLGDRYRDWNRGVLGTIRDIDAIVIHQYWGLDDNAAPGSDVDQTLSAGLDHWSKMRRLATEDLDHASEPNGDIDVWITEWNQAAHFAPPGTQIWAQALSVVMVGMEHALDPRVAMSLVHNILDGVGNPHDVGPSVVYPSFTNGEDGTALYDRTALGMALPLLFGAADGKTTVQRLTSNVEPISSRLSGIVLTGDRTEVVVVNPTGKLMTVRLPEPVSVALGRSPTVIEVHADADAAIGWDPCTTVTPSVTPLDGPNATLTLPGFSIARVGPSP